MKRNEIAEFSIDDDGRIAFLTTAGERKWFFDERDDAKWVHTLRDHGALFCDEFKPGMRFVACRLPNRRGILFLEAGQ